jgi:MoxR-like ATPase
MENGIKCKVCGHEALDYLGDHLVEAHGLTVTEYLAKYPGAPTISKRLSEAFAAKAKKIRRTGPPALDALKVKFAGVTLPVNTAVPAEACASYPDNYVVPEHGELGDDVQAFALVWGDPECPPTFIHGEPGCGKDALVEVLSYLTLTPQIKRSIVPGTDIQSWFFTRELDKDGTHYELGPVLLALRDGYTCPDGTVVPYLFHITDFDRADKSQAEYLRLITDTIEGQVVGPKGECFKVLEGTRVVTTANSAGGGDVRGRCISANPIDASILDRFLVALHFHQLDWADEEKICRAKFPVLGERCPGIFKVMGRITTALRKAIKDETLYAEFSHRGVVSILKHATRLVRQKDGIPTNLLKKAARVWVDKLPDDDTRSVAWNVMDPHIKGGTLDAGDTTHVQTGTKSLANGF